MQRITVVLGIAWLVVVSGGGTWVAFQPPVHPTLPPNRIERQVGIGESDWTLNYPVEAPLDGWYFPLIQQLEAGGWTRRNAGYAGRPLPLLDPVAYEHRTAFGRFVLWERVELHGDMHGRQVRIRRWIALES